jgi:hypothetical protein
LNKAKKKKEKALGNTKFPWKLEKKRIRKRLGMKPEKNKLKK